MSTKLPRTNSQINVPEVRLIKDDGEMVGVLSTAEALKMAYAENLDLIEISPNANPPVCKVGNFGKYKYELQKKGAELKKKSKASDLKELQFTVNIGIHDYQCKLRRIFNFIKDGYHVKVSCRVKGRDKAHLGRMETLFDRVIEDVSAVATVMGKVQLSGSRGDFTLVRRQVPLAMVKPEVDSDSISEGDAKPVGSTSTPASA